MGWDITNGGFRVVLDAGVPGVVRTYLAGDVDGFLADHGLTRKTSPPGSATPAAPASSRRSSRPWTCPRTPST